MADFQVPDPESLEYVDKIRKLEPTDRAHANIFNAIFQILINNIAFLKRKIEKKIVFGSSSTPLEPGMTLFVVDDWVEPEKSAKFEGASYNNLLFQAETPSDGTTENWGQTPAAVTRSPTLQVEKENIISGKLAVSRETPKDAAFFAKIN
ncbi:MAG: hypothetical protein Q4D90_02490 [bacterium]|nr:hypothetical protein [bacterium]